MAVARLKTHGVYRETQTRREERRKGNDGGGTGREKLRKRIKQTVTKNVRNFNLCRIGEITRT